METQPASQPIIPFQGTGMRIELRAHCVQSTHCCLSNFCFVSSGLSLCVHVSVAPTRLTEENKWLMNGIEQVKSEASNGKMFFGPAQLLLDILF